MKTLEVIFSPFQWFAVVAYCKLQPSTYLVTFLKYFAQCVSCHVCSCLPLSGNDLREIFLNALEPKRKPNRKDFVVYAVLADCFWTRASVLSQTICNYLNLYFLLHGARRPTRGKSIGSPQVFSEYVFRLGHAHGPPDSWHAWEPFQALIPSGIFLLRLPFLKLFGLSVASSIPHPFPRWLSVV